MKIQLTLTLESDFHVGTGAGVGRTVDSVVICDEFDNPFIPASSLKGLTRWHARQLLKLKPLHSFRNADLPDELFGSTGQDPGLLYFDSARQLQRKLTKQVHGRSARERESGRAKPEALFFIEDAAASEFRADITSSAELREHAMLLLLMSLRRIEALGAQRRRGKGRVAVHVAVDALGSAFSGLKLPEADDPRFAKLFQEIVARPIADRRCTRNVTVPAAATFQPTGKSKTLIVYAHAAQPLVLSDDPQTDNIIGCLDYVSGSAFRGAVANQLIHQLGWRPDDSPFLDSITREQLRFGPLYPCGNRPGSEETLPFAPPRSFMTCKYYRGVMDLHWENGKRHGLVDVLWTDPLCQCRRETANGELSQDGELPQVCGAPLVPCDKFLQVCLGSSGSAGMDKRLSEVHVQRQSIQRNEIHADTLGSAEGVLYSTEVIPRGTWFAGYISGETALVNQLRSAWGDADRVLRVGKSLTRGHGAIEVWLTDPGSEHAFPGLLPAEHQIEAQDEFTLMLYSDTIAVDSCLRPITHLDSGGHNLWYLLGGDGESPFRVERGYCSCRRIGGFNGLPGIPRSVDVALTAGSCWRIRWRDSSNADDKQRGIRQLRHAMEFGIGLRRGEGFGYVLVNFPLQNLRLNQTEADHFKELEFATDVVTLPQRLPHDFAPARSPAVSSLISSSELQNLLERVTVNNRVGLARLLQTVSQDEHPEKLLWGALRQRLSFAHVHGEPAWDDNQLDELEQRLLARQPPSDNEKSLSKENAAFTWLIRQRAPDMPLVEFRRRLAECIDCLTKPQHKT